MNGTIPHANRAARKYSNGNKTLFHVLAECTARGSEEGGGDEVRKRPFPVPQKNCQTQNFDKILPNFSPRNSFGSCLATNSLTGSQSTFTL